jgi:hypothetical protein
VPLHGAAADEQPCGDLLVSASLAGQLGDLLLLRRQVGAGVVAALARRLAGRLELSPRPFGDGLGAYGRERVERGPQLVTGLGAPLLPAQPFALDQAGAGQVVAIRVLPSSSTASRYSPGGRDQPADRSLWPAPRVRLAAAVAQAREYMRSAGYPLTGWPS